MADEEKKVEDGQEEASASQEEETGKEQEAPSQDPNTPESTPEDTEPVEVPEKFKKLVEEVENMTVLELHELVKVLEKRFGVSAQAVAIQGPAAGGEAEGDGQSEFAVELTEIGDQKIAVIKVVKEVLALGLKEAKDLVEGAPSLLKEGLKKEAAEEMKAKIEGAGGKVTLK